MMKKLVLATGIALTALAAGCGGAVAEQPASAGKPTVVLVHGAFAADVEQNVAEQMAATQRPITAAALEEPATRTAWKTIPSWNLVTTEDLAIPAESMRFMGPRANSHSVEIDASHAVAVSRPDAVADLIVQAANATTT